MSTYDFPGYPPATLSHEKSVRFLHLGSSWVQGAMSLRDTDALVLDYVQLMMAWLLFESTPQHIVQLGLGSAALTKFCHRHLPQARITALDINPNVIAICRDYFCLPPNDARLQVVQKNALDFVNDAANHDSVDIFQVDLYDEEARGPVLGDAAFYRACHACLHDQGMLVSNLFGGKIDENMDALQEVFDAVVWLPAEGGENLVVLAFKTAPSIQFNLLFARAAQIHASTGLRTKAWVLALHDWMSEA